MTALLTVLLLAADPPATTDPPATRGKKAEPARKADAKSTAKKDDGKKESLFKRKRAESKKDDLDDPGLTPEGPTPAKDAKKEPAKEKLTDADKDLVKSLGGALAGDEEDPLQRAAQRMREVEEQLAKLLIEQQTVATQDRIIADLKEVIERAKKKQQQQQQQQQNQQKSQQEQQEEQERQKQSQQRNQKQESNQAAQKAGGPRNAKEDLSKQKERQDVWGHLPDLERQLLIQSFRDEKLPSFRTQLEKYYSKIAEMGRDKDK